MKFEVLLRTADRERAVALFQEPNESFSVAIPDAGCVVAPVDDDDDNDAARPRRTPRQASTVARRYESQAGLPAVIWMLIAGFMRLPEIRQMLVVFRSARPAVGAIARSFTSLAHLGNRWPSASAWSSMARRGELEHLTRLSFGSFCGPARICLLSRGPLRPFLASAMVLRKLTCLDLHGVSVDATALRQLLRAAPALAECYLHQASTPCAATLAALPVTCPSLTRLSLAGCDTVDNATIAGIAKLTQLVALSVARTSLTWDGIALLSKTTSPISRLHLPVFGPLAMARLDRFASLTTLQLQGARHLTPDDAEFLGGGCPRLADLDLSAGDLCPGLAIADFMAAFVAARKKTTQGRQSVRIDVSNCTPGCSRHMCTEIEARAAAAGLDLTLTYEDKRRASLGVSLASSNVCATERAAHARNFSMEDYIAYHLEIWIRRHLPVDAPTFAVGADVEATWAGGIRWYPATIVARNDDGTYHARFKDGDEEQWVPPGRVRRGTFRPGDAVLATWRGGSQLWEAHVVAALDRDTYALKYDDDGLMDSVGLSHIRERRNAVAPALESRDHRPPWLENFFTASDRRAHIAEGSIHLFPLDADCDPQPPPLSHPTEPRSYLSAVPGHPPAAPKRRGVLGRLIDFLFR